LRNGGAVGFDAEAERRLVIFRFGARTRMPVATRSRITAACVGGVGGEGAQAWGSAAPAPAPRDGVASYHHGLKERMLALTLQHQQLVATAQAGGAAARQHRRSIRSPSAAEVVNDENAKNAEEEKDQGGGVARRHHDDSPRVPEAAVLRENVAPPQPRASSNSKYSRVVVFPRSAEPQEKDPIKKAVRVPVLPAPPTRKLSLGGVVGFKAATEVGAGTAEAAENRILVFVRLRPMSRKEKEAGSRSCVKIVNKKEVYLTEYASENDYLRLKRVRGRHFCFDSAFPDSTTQAEIYNTS